jgi:hypothetical protein
VLERLDPPIPLELLDRACPANRDCGYDYPPDPVRPFEGTTMGVSDCTDRKGNLMYGSWSDFAWEGPVRQGGVFPLRDHTILVLRCTETNLQIHWPNVLYATDPEGLEGAVLAPGDVFVPFAGRATIDNRFVASARVEGDAGGAPDRVTFTVEGLGFLPDVYRDLGVGDSFAWGDRRGTVVRFVAREGSTWGAIGWVEIALAPALASPPSTAPEAPDAGPRNPPRDPPKPAGSRSSGG